MSPHVPPPSPAPIPVLETARLILRGHGAADLQGVHAMWSDPAVAGAIGMPPATLEDAWARLLRYAGLWALLGYGYWAVVEKATGKLVGGIGFADFHRELTPSLVGCPELGWAIAPCAQGRGYSTEAVQAALAWGETQWGGAPTVCLIGPDNAPSLRVAAKAGFREFARCDYKGRPVILFRRRGPGGSAGGGGRK